MSNGMINIFIGTACISLLMPSAFYKLEKISNFGTQRPERKRFLPRRCSSLHINTNNAWRHKQKFEKSLSFD